MKIEWLVPKWLGYQENVSSSRVQTKGPLHVGMEVKVAYKSGVYKAKIVDMDGGKYSAFYLVYCMHRVILQYW